MYITVSQPTKVLDGTASHRTDPVHVITQFYDAISTRQKELQYALSKNVENPFIDSIVLINERIFSDQELGVSSPKIIQTVLGRRLRYSDALDYKNTLNGFIAILNADIYLDDSIENIRNANINIHRTVYALLRYEHATQQLFGPRPDSQDTFIMHSSISIPAHVFDFELGTPGCDNKLCYLFSCLGYEVRNDPLFIKTFHCHASTVRCYSPSLPPPYLFVAPANVDCTVFNRPLTQIRHIVSRYDFVSGNLRLLVHLNNIRAPFVIPRVAGIENNTAYAGHLDRPISHALCKVMKRNAGIHLPDMASARAYAAAYLLPFQRCKVYASWEPWSHYTPHVKESQDFIQETYQKPQIGAFVFDIFHYIHEPWTHGLRGKRLLIVSPFVDQIRKQPQAYRNPLFPDCTFQYMKPPQTHGIEPSRPWHEEFADFCAAVDAVDFDVALCSCGGYGNPICGHIYAKGRSAIYVGGVLQMYFGIYGNRWLNERPEMVSMHRSSTWTRPTEKPQGFDEIEGSCYW